MQDLVTRKFSPSSAVKHTCSFRGSAFSCQHPHVGLQPLLIPVLGNLTVSSDP